MNWLDQKAHGLLKPIIIWLCQRTGWSQMRLYRYGWMAAMIISLYYNMTRGTNWFMMVLVIFAAAITTVSAALFPDLPASDPDTPWNLGFRILWIILESTELLFLAIVLIVEHNIHASSGNLVGPLILLAEYARTVKTIPPRKIKEPKRRLATVRT